MDVGEMQIAVRGIRGSNFSEPGAFLRTVRYCDGDRDERSCTESLMYT